MKTITQNQLVQMIMATNGAAIVGLLALTDSRARKTGNPHGKIFKQIRTVGIVGADYQGAVNREGGRQGVETDFTAEQLPWGEWLVLNKLIKNGDKLYLRTQSTPGNRRVQPARVLSYRNEAGQFISPDEAKKFIPAARESVKQQGAGLNKTVWVRTYAFDSIQKIRMNGETFQLI